MDATHIPAPIPFHAARAYGVAGAARPPGVESTPAVATARINVQDKVELTANSPQARAMRERVAGLVAAKVEQGVDFVAAGVNATPGAIPMYRHPADKHAAATAVDVGRGLDVRG